MCSLLLKLLFCHILFLFSPLILDFLTCTLLKKYIPSRSLSVQDSHAASLQTLLSFSSFIFRTFFFAVCVLNLHQDCQLWEIWGTDPGNGGVWGGEKSQ